MTPSRTPPLERYKAVFFDLDGTLVDTAPDMVAVLAELQKSNGCEPLAYDVARASVSNGALGLVRLAFPDLPDVDCQRLHADYLDRYQQAVCVGSVLFPGLDRLLDRLDARRLPWGVVTNKPRRMTEPLLEQLGLIDRVCCAISGDTLPQKKPDPAPLLLASERAGVPAERSIYVGDASRDIAAGKAAGMCTVAAAYGYIVPGDDPAGWRADHVVRDTAELSRLVARATQLEA